MARNRKTNKQRKTPAASRAGPLTNAPPPVTTTNDLPFPAADAPPATVAQDHTLSLLHHQRTRLRHHGSFPSTFTPHTPILTPHPELPLAFTDLDLKLLKEADAFLAERTILPTENEEIDALLESFSAENMPDYLLQFYHERQQAAAKTHETETFLYQATMKPLEALLQHAHEQEQGSHARRQAAANRWYTHHARAILHPPITDKAVDTFGDFETLHISTQPSIPTREKAAVTAGIAALARVYSETMALWHSPLLFTRTEEQALIVRRMEGNRLLLDAVFRSWGGTSVGVTGRESEAMEVLGCLGGMVEEERCGYVGRARGLAEYARAGNALGGDGGGGFIIDEGKAMLAEAVAMGYGGETGVWVGQRKSGCGFMEEEEDDDPWAHSDASD